MVLELEVTNFERSRSKSSSTRFRLSDTANSESDLWCFLVLFALDADIVVFSETEALNVRVLEMRCGALRSNGFEKLESKCEGFARRSNRILFLNSNFRTPFFLYIYYSFFFLSIYVNSKKKKKELR